MPASTTPVNTNESTGQGFANVPIAAGIILNAGALAAANAAGAATPAADAAGLRLLGVVQQAPLQSQFDSLQTYGPATGVDAKRGIFVFANSTTSPVVQGDLGSDVYVQDDQTVAHSSTHSLVAGVFLGFYNGDATQVIVDSTAARFSVSGATS
jgi:hypothetical protein